MQRPRHFLPGLAGRRPLGRSRLRSQRPGPLRLADAHTLTHTRTQLASRRRPLRPGTHVADIRAPSRNVLRAALTSRQAFQPGHPQPCIPLFGGPSGYLPGACCGACFFGRLLAVALACGGAQFGRRREFPPPASVLCPDFQRSSSPAGSPATHPRLPRTAETVSASLSAACQHGYRLGLPGCLAACAVNVQEGSRDEVGHG